MPSQPNRNPIKHMPKELKSSPTPSRTPKRIRGLQIFVAAKHRWFADNTPGLGASELHQWVWARMTAPEREFSLLFQPKAGSTWVDYAPGEIAQAANELVGLLKHLSGEQPSVALGVLADMATDTTILLSRIAKIVPELLVPVARKRILWPVLTSSMKGFGDDAKQVAKDVGLGASPVFSADLLRLKTFRADSTATRKAVELIIAIENQRDPARYQFRQPVEWEKRAREVEPFSASTWPAWFKIAWLKVLADTKDKPQDSEELHPLGIGRAKREMKRHVRSAAAAPRYPGSEQDGIKERIEAAFESLSGARKQSPRTSGLSPKLQERTGPRR